MAVFSGSGSGTPSGAPSSPRWLVWFIALLLTGAFLFQVVVDVGVVARVVCEAVGRCKSTTPDSAMQSSAPAGGINNVEDCSAVNVGMFNSSTQSCPPGGQVAPLQQREPDRP